MFDENPFEPGVSGGSGRAHLADYAAILLRRRFLIAACVVLGVGVALLLALTTPSSYRATAVLDIGNERTAGMDLGLADSQKPAEPDPDFQATQIRLIGSLDVAQRVVAKLDLAANPAFSGRSRSLSSKPSAPKSAVELQKHLTWLARRVQRELQISPVRGTDLVEVSAVASSPRVAADVANATADAYIEWKVDSMYRAMNQISTFLGTQIAQLKRDVDAQQEKLNAFGKANDIVSADPQANSGLQNFEALNRDYEGAVADRVAKEARLHGLQSASAATVAADPTAAAVLAPLQSEQARLEREYGEKLNLFKPEWPAMVALKAQIEKGRQHLQSATEQAAGRVRASAENDYQTARRREANLAGALKNQRSATMEGNSNAVAYNNLRGEIDTKKALLDTLLRRQAETEVLARQKGARESNVRVVDRAQAPESRFRPSYRVNGMLGLFAGLGFGLLVAFFLEYMDRSLRSAEQVQSEIGLPTLGTIPIVGQGARSLAYVPKFARREKAPGDSPVPELVPFTEPHSAAAEAYRRVRTALLLSQAGGVKSIVVTSGFAQEGKTCTAANLAVILSQLNRKVLLVDADMHKPRLHQIFRASNRQGLVTMLAENLEPSRCIVKTGVPGVFLLPAGPASPNPSGLISSAAMSGFLEAARREFDFVVLDTPPIFPLSDALVLGHQTDGVVLCVRAGKTSRPQVERAKAALLQNQNRILGVVLNGLEDAGDVEGYGLYFASPDEPSEGRSSVTALRG